MRANLPPREVVEVAAQPQIAQEHREKRDRETGDEDREAEGQRVGVVDPPPQDGAVAPSFKEYPRQSREEPGGWVVVLELVRPAVADRPYTVHLLRCEQEHEEDDQERLRLEDVHHHFLHHHRISTLWFRCPSPP